MSTISEPWNQAVSASTRLNVGRLQKTSGAFQTFQERDVELHPGYLYLYKDHEKVPYSRIPLLGLTVTNTNESPFGFCLVNGEGEKVKFVCESMDSKRIWIGSIHEQIDKVSLGGTGGGNKQLVDRSEPPLCEGFLQKRGGGIGSGSYNPRWCELRQNVGIVYAKYQSSSDDSFKHVALQGNRVSFRDDKLRFDVETLDDHYFFKCGSREDYEVWRDTILGVNGRDEAGESPAPSNSSRIAATEPDEEEDLDGETLMDLADLEAPQPIHSKAMSPERERTKLIRGKVIQIESVFREFCAIKRSAGFDSKFKAHIASKTNYDLEDMIARFRDRMFVPITTPYSAVNEHINLLDLDATKLRELLNGILDRFGDEEGAFITIESLDGTLRMFMACRERLIVRRDIAQFREQEGKCGLHLGVNGTLKFVDKLTVRDRGSPSMDNYRRMQDVVRQLYSALDEFRTEYDVFEEAEDTILEIEDAILQTEAWLEIHETVLQ